LRDYGVSGLGLEATPTEYIASMLDVFREVQRVLRADGTVWINMGDGYCASPNSGTGWESSTLTKPNGRPRRAQIAQIASMRRGRDFGDLKPKDLVGMPWMLAFALREAGWWLRQDLIWHKPNPMPESVRDRCTKAHEYIFLLSKSERYHFDADAISEPVSGNAHPRGDGINAKIKVPSGWDTGEGAHGTIHREGRTQQPEYRPRQNPSFSGAINGMVERRNKRSVWTVGTEGYAEAHFATFPPDLIEPCILAGCPEGGTVLDPFGGAGTTGLVADRHHRNAILIELNPEYVEMARKRIFNDAPLFASVS
jgi:DNA modification methylase